MAIVTVQTTREGTRYGVDHVIAEERAAIIEAISDVLEHRKALAAKAGAGAR